MAEKQLKVLTDPQKVAEVLEQIAKMLRGNPTAGVYNLYVAVAVVVEQAR